jgi:glycosyltransferase involved in cell wall biosynthesis
MHPKLAIRVSVVIPAFNAAAFLDEAVSAAMTQSRPPHEILIVDDGSTDDTSRRAAMWPSPVRLIRQRNAGVSAARNRAVAEATGEAVAFLDADDVWHPGKLEAQVAVLAKDAECVAVATRTFDWPAPGRLADHRPGLVSTIGRDDLLVCNGLTASSLVVRRDVLERAGPFDTMLQGPEDYDMWLRVAAFGPIRMLEEPLTGYRAVEGSLSRDPRKMEEGVLRILAKLDAASAWRGKGLTRARAYAHQYFSSAYTYRQAGQQAMAIRRVARSLTKYPFPLRRSAEHGGRAARFRLLAAALRELAG